MSKAFWVAAGGMAVVLTVITVCFKERTELNRRQDEAAIRQVIAEQCVSVIILTGIIREDREHRFGENQKKVLTEAISRCVAFLPACAGAEDTALCRTPAGKVQLEPLLPGDKWWQVPPKVVPQSPPEPAPHQPPRLPRSGDPNPLG